MATDVRQTHFRFGKDDDTEAAHTFWQLEDVNHSQFISANWTFLLRFTEQESGGTAAANTDAQFQYNKNAAGWVNITTTSSVVKAVVVNAFTDGQNATKRLSGTGTFETTGAGCTEDGLSGGTANDIAASGNSETEAGLQVVFADVANNDTIQFRFTSPDWTITYTITPTLTITKPVNITVTPNTINLTTTRYAPVIIVSNNITVTPGTLTLLTTRYVPSVVSGTIVVPSTSALITTLYAPTITIETPGTTVTPGTASLIVTRYAPSIVVSENLLVTLGLASLNLSIYAPVVTLSNNIVVNLGQATLTLSTLTPSLVLGTIVTPNTAALFHLNAFPPIITISENLIVTLGTGTLTLTSYASLAAVTTSDIERLLEIRMNDLAPIVANIHQILTGKWKISNNQLVFYDADNVTPLVIFNLKGAGGEPNSIRVFEREPV